MNLYLSSTFVSIYLLLTTVCMCEIRIKYIEILFVKIDPSISRRSQISFSSRAYLLPADFRFMTSLLREGYIARNENTILCTFLRALARIVYKNL